MRQIRLDSPYIHRIIREAIMDIVKEEMDKPEERVDKYGIPIVKNGQGYGPDPDNLKMRNRPGKEMDGSPGPWFSRSVAAATCVLLKDTDTDKWYVLAGKRGRGAPDYMGYWNLPCGYLDYNEDVQEAAAREVAEETGIRLNKNQLKLFGHSSSPYENKQNVVFYFVAILQESKKSLPFSFENMEVDEVAGAQWLPLEKKDSLMWAFDHDELLDRVLAKYGHLIYGDNDNPQEIKDKVMKVINILSSKGDTEYAIEILKSLL